MIIALLTDFGTKDYFVGAMKGAILSIATDSAIVDITHEIAAHDIKSAAFTLASCYRDFPAKTIFVCVVDPGVGSNRRSIAVETPEHIFIAPDNGSLTYVLENETEYRVFFIENPKFVRINKATTFHGRDIFAPAAAWLAKGTSVADLGKEIREPVLIEIPSPLIKSASEISAQILHIDRFGNLITNLRESDLKGKFSIFLNETHINKHCLYYAEIPQNELMSIWGSAGYLEIVANMNSAAEILNASVGNHLTVNIRKT